GRSGADDVTMRANAPRPARNGSGSTAERPVRLVPPMKLKCQPEDFQVEELTEARPGPSGRYTFYRLTTRDLGTMEAVEGICRRWNLSGRQVSYAGLKDRHASTIQYLTIADGPSRDLRAPQFDLEPIGRLTQPYTSRQLMGNRFALVL